MPDDAPERDEEHTERDEIERLLEEGATDEALVALQTLHPADQAEFIGQLDADLRAPLLPRLGQDALADILSYLKEEPRRAVVDELEPAALGPLLDRVDRDDAVDILHDIGPERAQAVMSRMSTAPDVAPLLMHEDETAGGRMTSDYVALQQEWTVDDALSYLRRTRPAAEQVFYLYVIDDQGRLEGVVSLRHLVVATPETRIGDLMTPEVMSVQVGEDQEEVARSIQRYNFIALPVVDDERRLVGVVTVDDVMDVVEEEATEDMYRMAGLVEDESLQRPVLRSIAPRLAWLAVAMVSVFAAAGVVSAFEDTIAQAAALAVFMPVIGGLGGNTGIQTITLVVRSLAIGQIELRDVRSVLGRELVIGLANGLILSFVLAMVVYLWKDNVGLSVVAGTALLLNMVTGVTAGVLVPVSLRAFKLDPALASGVLLTTFTDVLGFFFFLGLASLMIDRIA